PTVGRREASHLNQQRSANFTPPSPPAQRSDQVANVVEIATTSSAFDGVKVRDVSATEVGEKSVMRFIKKVSEDDDIEDDNNSIDEDAQVMAGERARRFSELPPEFDGEEGPTRQ